MLSTLAALILLPALQAAPGLTSVAACGLDAPLPGACAWIRHETLFEGATWQVSSAPVASADGELVYYTVAGGLVSGVTAQRASDGATAWIDVETVGPGALPHLSTSAGATPRLLVGGYAWELREGWQRDSYVASIDPATGATRWSDQIEAAPGSNGTLHSIALSGDGSRAFASTSSHSNSGVRSSSLRAFDTETGALLWERQGDVVARTLLTDDATGTLVAIDHGGYPMALDAQTGALRWHVTSLTWPGAYFLMEDVWLDGHEAIDAGHERIVLATTVREYGSLPGGLLGTDAYVASFSLQTGELGWAQRFDLGASNERVHGLVLGEEQIFVDVATDQGNALLEKNAILALDAASGSPLWSAPLLTPMTSLVASPTGDIVYAAGKTANYYAGTLYSHNVHLAALHAATGAPLWTHTYEREINSHADLDGIALANEGRTLIARMSNGASEDVYATLPNVQEEDEGPIVTLALRAR